MGIEGHSRWARLKQTTYLATGARVVRMRRKHTGKKRQLEASVGTLTGQEPVLQLRKGDHLILTRSQAPGRLAKDGRPSRAEVTDAAIAERAECVMLNKGPFVVDAVRALDSILKRMQGHQEKKRPLLRPLKLAETFFAAGAASNGRAAVPGRHRIGYALPLDRVRPRAYYRTYYLAEEDP